MNERMKQIAERSGLYGVKDYDNTISEDVSKVRLDKFAELIVQECIDALWTEECHTSDLAVEDYNRKSKKIKQHFGVEGDWITHSLSGKGAGGGAGGGGAGVTVTKEGISWCQTYKS
ncbi:hypothetical protein UFOVP1666_198, partial [uncultured Caudovirales phage]